MKKFSSEKGSSDDLAEICITPLADLALCMLITLLLISPMMVSSMIKVSSAQAVAARSAQADLKEKPLYIDVTNKGLYLNSNRMKNEEDLFLKLRGELSRKKDKSVLVTGEAKVRHGLVVHVLDISKQAGAENISLLKRKKS